MNIPITTQGPQAAARMEAYPSGPRTKRADGVVIIPMRKMEQAEAIKKRPLQFL